MRISDRAFVRTAPIFIVGGAILLNTGGREWWRILVGVLLLAWGLAWGISPRGVR